MERYITNTYESADSYKKILLHSGEAKVKIEPSNDDKTKVVFFEKKSRPYEIFIYDDTLTIQSEKTRWYDRLHIGFDRSKIRLCVPKTTLEALSIKSNVGRVDISSVNCGAIDIKINTGKVNVENVFCKTFGSKGNTGSVSLNQLTAEKSVFIKTNTGKVFLNGCASPEIFVKTNTGKVCGRLPSHTAFIVRTNTGKTELPKIPVGEVIGGRCEIKTNTGNVTFE